MRRIPGPILNSELILAGLLMLFAAPFSLAESNIQPDRSLAWGANVGWTNSRPHSSDGVEIAEFICSGYIYAANIGWIHLGSGSPANGIHYQNNSATDFGVNHDQIGNLRGFAYGANVGWIQFEDKGAPRVDLTNGELSGYIYGANIGWINLDGLSITSLAPGSDSDQDGIPDAWEVLQAGDLTKLGRNTDTDRDGTTDFEEYLADTNPLDPVDALRITQFTLSSLASTLTWPSKPTRNYVVQSRPAFETDGIWTRSSAEAQRGTGQPITAEIVNNPQQGQSFFRIQVLRPLSTPTAQ